MSDYYAKKLSGARLQRVYEIATPRIRQYIRAETDHVVRNIQPGDKVLDLGCGYGRIIPDLAQQAGYVTGIDNSPENIAFGKEFCKDIPNCNLFLMDAGSMTFPDNSFDVVICIQNGISAFGLDPEILVKESLRVAVPGGKVLFSSYSEKIWEARLEWFRLQADEGLLGDIDEHKTGNGQIFCKDGFRATTFTKERFEQLVDKLSVPFYVSEVDNSSLFCEIIA